MPKSQNSRASRIAWLTALCIVLLAGCGSRAAAQTRAAVDPPEIRALWVDAFHAGIRSREETDALVEAARGAHFNTLFVQVRRRGDALYTRGIEPPVEDPAYDPSFDALAYVIEAAHGAGLQVHAWVNAMPTWRDEAAPKDPRHLFNRHGPASTGVDNWFTASPTGDLKFPVGYFVDPGHPAAAAYLTDIYLNLVRTYAIDGIHFDYIRYPETADQLPRGAAVGYNAVNLERFRRATGRSDAPAPGDEAWMAWRREQVTNLVRRVSIEARAINPKIRISAALIPWGAPPERDKDFADAAPMQRVFQNWHQWLRDGLIDLAVPMNYAAETDDRVRGWFDGWIRWEKHHKHGRLLAIGIGAYRNTPDHTIAQIARARVANRGKRADGVSIYSYAAPRVSADAGGQSASQPAPGTAPARGTLAYLSSVSEADKPPFQHPAPVPAMPWIDHPQRGWIAGIVSGATPGEADGAIVNVKRAGGFPFFRRTRHTRTDGNGYYGLTNVKPGRYRVWLHERGAKKRRLEVRVEAGKVTRTDL